MCREVPYGYQLVDGQLQPHPIDSQFVRWMFSANEAYREHPPIELVNEVIESYFQETGKQLSYADAEKLVSESSIEKYMVSEINAKKALYLKTSQESDPERLKIILALTFEEVSAALNESSLEK